MLFFVGCGNKPNDEIPTNSVPTCSSCGVEVSTEGDLCSECKKVTLYKKYLGTWDAKYYETVTGKINNGIECYYTVIFAEDSVSFDGNTFLLNPLKDVFLEEEMEEPYKLRGKPSI